MATIPVILLNGTTADANDVMSDFNEIYSNIDETNIAVANKTGTGRIVLQTSPTINTPTLTSPTVSGTISGAFNFSSNITFSAGITLPTTQRVNLNVGGTSFLRESSANVVALDVNGNTGWTIDNNGSALVFIGGHFNFSIDPAKRLYLDGGVNTYISMASPGEIGFFTGGGAARFTVSNTVAAVDSTINFQIASTRRMYFDGGSSVWMDSPSANVMRFVTSSTEAARFDASGNTLLSGSLIVNTGQSIGVDGVGGNDYIIGSAANQISIYTGGTERLRLNNGSNYTEIRSGSLIIQPGANFFLDGGVDTYIYEYAANSMAIVCGTTDVIHFQASGVTLQPTQDLFIQPNRRIYLDGGTNDYWTNSANGQNDLYAAGTLAIRTGSNGHVEFGNGIVPTNAPATPNANYCYVEGYAKAYASCTGAGAAVGPRFNCTISSGFPPVGNVVVTFATAMNSANYRVIATPTSLGVVNVVSKVAGSFVVQGYDFAGATASVDFDFVVFGVQ